MLRWPQKRGRPNSSHAANDRFIANRAAMNQDVSHFELTRKYHSVESTDVNRSPAKEEYKRELAQTLMQTSGASSKVLAFGAKAPQQMIDHENALRNHFTHNREASKLPRKYTRHIPQDAERILDAPDLINDFYLNLLDWSSNNSLGVALGDSIYLWNANNGSIQTLMKTQGENSHVTSLAWIQQGNYMAVGTSDHEVQIWDVDKCRQIRSMCGHSARVGALSWNGPVLSSGSRDSSVIQHDVRIADHKVGTLNGHTQEVCGLKWSPAGTLLASGGNDNLLNLWDDRYQTRVVPIVKGGSIDAPLHRLNAHKAAVKALAWCPWQKSLLASGGGTADCMIRFWNSSSGVCLNAVDTQSQVSALQWSLHDKELVSSHGYSHNQLNLWRYPSMVKVAELTGHTARILHIAQSPDGQTVVTASADETVRFWKILSGGDASKKEREAAKDSILNSHAIR